MMWMGNKGGSLREIGWPHHNKGNVQGYMQEERKEYEGTKETDGERQGLIETGTEEKGLLLVAGVS
jgi:hypothetical protein